METQQQQLSEGERMRRVQAMEEQLNHLRRQQSLLMVGASAESVASFERMKGAADAAVVDFLKEQQSTGRTSAAEVSQKRCLINDQLFT